MTKEQRDAVVAEARSWIGTPFRARSMTRGAGCDCATLAAGVYLATAMLPDNFQMPKQYSVHFGLHTDDEIYLRMAREWLQEIPAGEAKPGDLILLHLGRTWSHGAILIDWPMAINADERNGARYVNIEIDPPFRRREKRFFTPKV